jgi:diacylglycerol kinase (ATP)
VSLAAVTGLNGTEWALLIFAMAGVWSAEAMNTGFEFLCNVASPEPHPLVRQAKDVAAAAVLLAAIAAMAVGLIVFLPHLPV